MLLDVKKSIKVIKGTDVVVIREDVVLFAFAIVVVTNVDDED